MALPTGQMNNNLLLRQRGFSSVTNDISADKSLKMELKRPTLDSSNSKTSGKSFYSFLRSDNEMENLKSELNSGYC